MMAQNEELHELDDVSYDPKEMKWCWMLFLGTIIALIGHVGIEQLLGLPKNTMLVATSLGAGAIAIVFEFLMPWFLTFSLRASQSRRVVLSTSM